MPTSKHVPTGLVSKFKAKNLSSRAGPIKTNLKYSPVKKEVSYSDSRIENEQIFSLTKLPILPCPSYELTEILFQFNDLNFNAPSNQYSKKARLPNQKKKFRSINGFIAFRSFYSRLVANPEHQRKLSIMLGKLWPLEPSRPIWNRYASEYNVTCHKYDNKLPFVDWLCDKLNLTESLSLNNDTNIVRNYNWKFSSSNSEGVVEDVYFTGEIPTSFNY